MALSARETLFVVVIGAVVVPFAMLADALILPGGTICSTDGRIVNGRGENYRGNLAVTERGFSCQACTLRA